MKLIILYLSVQTVRCIRGHQFGTDLALIFIIGIPGKTCELHALGIVECAAEGDVYKRQERPSDRKTDC